MLRESTEAIAIADRTEEAETRRPIPTKAGSLFDGERAGFEAVFRTYVRITTFCSLLLMRVLHPPYRLLLILLTRIARPTTIQYLLSLRSARKRAAEPGEGRAWHSRGGEPIEASPPSFSSCKSQYSSSRWPRASRLLPGSKGARSITFTSSVRSRSPRASPLTIRYKILWRPIVPGVNSRQSRGRHGEPPAPNMSSLRMQKVFASRIQIPL